jgi:hypothetical protein
MDLILVDPGTYTEALDFQSASGGWQKPVIIRGADPNNRPVIASTGAAQACQGGGAYRGTAGGETTLEDLTFSGWTNASNGVLYFSIAGIVVKRCHFTGNTGRTVMRWIGGSATRLGLVDSCTFETSGSSGTGEKGIVLTWTSFADVKNCKAICPLNVQFHNDAYSGSRYVEHNSVYGTWSSTVKVFTGLGVFRGNTIKNVGSGASHAIDASGGGTYTENVVGGTFTTRFAGIDGGGNQNADPLFANGAGGDLTLNLASPAIRSLARSANTLLDILGASRSDPTDAGAYEMSLATTITGVTVLSPTSIRLNLAALKANDATWTTAGNFTITPSGGAPAVTVSSAAVTGAGMSITLTTTEHLDGGAYTVAWSGLTNITSGSSAYTGQGAAPTITSARMTSPTTIDLTFSEAVDETSAETAANYTTTPARVVTAVRRTTTTVRLTLDRPAHALRLDVVGVEDVVGNAMT